MSQKIIRNEIIINAPAERVWKTLTDAEETKKYMYGCGAISDWEPGSALLWKGVFDGQELVAVKGTVVDIVPGSYLAYTTFDPNNTAIADIPENYLTVTYTLSEAPGGTLLVVTQGDYSAVAEGDKRYNDAVNAGGWSSILSEIKKVAEEV
ncbi:MAG: SRPBCC domain-containing protein [Bacteroidetes bacterium]|nr:SRPBCC domain-containing protein [Bacteroidota bacterium]